MKEIKDYFAQIETYLPDIGNVPYDELSYALSLFVNANFYFLDEEGIIFSYFLAEGFPCRELGEISLKGEAFPENFMGVINRVSAISDSFVFRTKTQCLFNPGLKCSMPERDIIVAPVFMGNKRKMTVIGARYNKPFNAEERCLISYFVNVLLREKLWQDAAEAEKNKSTARLVREKKKRVCMVDMTKTERDFYLRLIEELEHGEAVINLTEFAKNSNLSRATVQATFKKLRERGVLQTRNMGKIGVACKLGEDFRE